MVAHGASASSRNPFTVMVVIGPQVLSQTFGPQQEREAFLAFKRLERAAWSSRGAIERVYFWKKDVLAATGEKVAPPVQPKPAAPRPVRPYGEFFNRPQPVVFAEDIF